MSLEELRLKIDEADEKIITAFHERMLVVSEIAEYKRANALPVYIPERESAKLLDVISKSSDDMKPYMGPLYSLLFELSRLYQDRAMETDCELSRYINTVMEMPPNDATPIVACSKSDKSVFWSACEKLFDNPTIINFLSTEAVFEALEQDQCNYAVLSTCNSLYDNTGNLFYRIAEHNFSIVAKAEIKAKNIYNRDDTFHLICISKRPCITKDANITAVTAFVKDAPGEMYKLLAKFYALGINLVSFNCTGRTVGDKVICSLELGLPVTSDNFKYLIRDIDAYKDEIRYLGTYAEVF